MSRKRVLAEVRVGFFSPTFTDHTDSIALVGSLIEMTDLVTSFYTDLAPLYHLVYEDWHASIVRQAAMLDGVIRERWPHTRDVLDVSCGIGTQSIGLAKVGYRVTASDLVSAAVERAKKEVANFNVAVDLSVADMRDAYRHHGRRFDLVLAGDNSVPHLLSDGEILAALKAFYNCTREGGGCVISVRDYEAEDTSALETIKVYGTRRQGDVTYFVFQKWNFDRPYYDLSMYFVADDGSARCPTHVMRSRYYAIGIDRLCELMAVAGFKDVTRLDGRFFEPLIVGTRVD